jgi:anti-anti-sigma factor
MVDHEVIGNVVIIRVASNFDINQSLEVDAVVVELIRKGFDRFVFDLGNIHYLSSSGIRSFVETLRQTLKIKGRMTLANPSDPAVKILTLFDLSGHFHIVENVDTAVKELND